MSAQKSTKRPTIYDVAALAGVSKSLVSLVLRDSPQVSPARREAVLKAIQILNYEPNVAASNLAGKSSGLIGVVIDDYSNTWFIQTLKGLREIFDEAGYHLAVSDLHEVRSRHSDAASALLAMKVDGLVVAAEPSTLSDRSTDIPYVIIGSRQTRPKRADVVTGSDELGAELVVDHLADLGHKVIGHITGRDGAAHKRLDGFLSQTKARGCTGYIAGEGRATDEATGYDCTLELMKEHPEITAIFAANDFMAAGAIAALKKLKKRVPQDISVSGYDDTVIAGPKFLDLTTVSDSGAEIGRQAAKLLLRRIKAAQTAPHDLDLVPTLIARGSTAQAKK